VPLVLEPFRKHRRHLAQRSLHFAFEIVNPLNVIIRAELLQQPIPRDEQSAPLFAMNALYIARAYRRARAGSVPI
jgi:hypothetical protein